MNRSALYIATAALTTLVVGLCGLAWAQSIRGDVGRYDMFALLGLLAWSLMWLHYVSGSLKRYLGLAADTTVLKRYFEVTSYMVLVLILLHPGLFFLALYQDGLGLPPASSFEVYTEPASRAALMLGSVSLTAFLLFELGRWFRGKKWWPLVEYASMAAMALIFVHALLLGSAVLMGWFRVVWCILGVLLVGAFVYNHWFDTHHKNKEA